MVGTRVVRLVDLVQVLDPNPRILDADYIQDNRSKETDISSRNSENDRETY